MMGQAYTDEQKAAFERLNAWAESSDSDFIADGETLAKEEEEKKRKEFLELLDSVRIHTNDTIEEKEYLLERDGVGFAPRGNICAIAAEKKAGKTWFCMAMCAALLKGDFLGMKAKIAPTDQTRVFYFDTEQDKGDGKHILRRVQYVCGWNFSIDNDKFQIFHLREKGWEERLEIVRKAICYHNPTMAIIDGIRDITDDINDQKNAVKLIQDFMNITSDTNACIWMVLHVNPNSDKMRGHLGTELANKCADLLYMTKHRDKDDEDIVTYKMQEPDARGHKEIHPIIFAIDDTPTYSLPFIVDEPKARKAQERKQADKQAANEQLANDDAILQKYLHNSPTLLFDAICRRIAEGEGIDKTEAQCIVNRGLETDLLIQHSDGRIRYFGRVDDWKIAFAKAEIPREGIVGQDALRNRMPKGWKNKEKFADALDKAIGDGFVIREGNTYKYNWQEDTMQTEMPLDGEEDATAAQGTDGMPFAARQGEPDFLPQGNKYVSSSFL